jgi:DNA polymerase-3 subunit beta
MKLSVSRTELFNKLSAVGVVINPKTTLAVAENFLFHIEDNKITITATDLETTLTTVLSVNQHDTGKLIVALPPKELDVLKTMSEQMVHFDFDEQSYQVTLTNDANFKAQFPAVNVGENGEDFPQPRKIEEDYKTFNLNSDVLLNGITKTVFATAEEDSRPTMTGIYFDIFPENIVFVATDAHKLVKLNALDVKSKLTGSFILPKKPSLALKSILGKSDGDIKVSFDEKNIRFELPDFTMICRQIEGRYPNYNSVIQQNNQLKMIIDRGSLLASVKMVKPTSDTGTGLIKMSITENQLHISSQNIDFATSAEDILVCQYSDEPLEIGFKGKLLEEILSNISAPEVVFELADASKAGLIVPMQNNENEELIMLLMPMFLS